MVYYRDQNLEDKDQQGGVQLSSGGSQADPAGAVEDQQFTGSSQPKTGSHFQNIDTYLKNNNSQAAGQQFGQNVQKSIDEAKNTINTQTEQAKSQINAGASTPTQEQITGAVASAGKNTTPDQAKQYQAWTNQSYQGPTSLADLQGAQNAITGGVSAAQEKAKLAGTEPGRFALLDQFYGRPSYNFGEKSLDNLLVARGGGFNNPQQYQNQAAQLGSYAGQQAQGVQQAASDAAGKVAASRAAARQAIGLGDNNTITGGPLTDIQKQIEGRITDYNQSQQDTYNNMLQQIQANRLNTTTANLVGLPKGTTLYDLDPSKYLQQGEQANKYAETNPEEYARYMALSQLAGTNPGYFGEGDADKLQQPLKGVSFKSPQFQADLAQRQGEYQAAYNQPMVHPELGPNPVSYKDMEDSVARWTNGTGDPNQAGPRYRDYVVKYQNALNQFNAAQGADKKLNLVGGNAVVPGNRGAITRDFSGLVKGLK